MTNGLWKNLSITIHYDYSLMESEAKKKTPNFNVNRYRKQFKKGTSF